MEDMMVDMLTEDERAVALLDRTCAFACERARFYAKAGVDILHVADDIGMQAAPMMAPDLWRKWIKPRTAKIIRVAKEANPDVFIRYHSCGYSLPFIEDLIEVGVEILNPIQPECMDLAEIHKRFGDRVSYWATIGTQSVLPFGTPEEVRAAVNRDLDICGTQGGIVISPTHTIEPEVPWENLEAMRLAAKEYKLKR
jgi:uroporphyrinogen decarboxylase